MLDNYFIPSKKLAAVVATMGLAGIAGVCGCQTSHTETGCCQVCRTGGSSAAGCSSLASRWAASAGLDATCKTACRARDRPINRAGTV